MPIYILTSGRIQKADSDTASRLFRRLCSALNPAVA